MQIFVGQGQQLVVVQLPFGSFTNGQTTQADITLNLSPNANP
jgi:hypothetical protein